MIWIASQCEGNASALGIFSCHKPRSPSHPMPSSLHAYCVQMEGVQGVFSASIFQSGQGDGRDRHYINEHGPLKHDEEVLASQEVHTAGQAVALVVADTEAQARAAAQAVDVRYQVLDSIVSVEQALACDSFLDEARPSCEILSFLCKQTPSVCDPVHQWICACLYVCMQAACGCQAYPITGGVFKYSVHSMSAM